MIKTKSIYKPQERGDGKRVLITRFYPRGIKKTHFDIWVRELAPSTILLNKYRNQDVSWEKFVKLFKTELQNNENSMEVLRNLHTKSQRSNITLLCYEPEGMPCHRHLLKEIIRDLGLLTSHFVSQYTDYHKGVFMEKHVAHQEAYIIP